MRLIIFAIALLATGLCMFFSTGCVHSPRPLPHIRSADPSASSALAGDEEFPAAPRMEREEPPPLPGIENGSIRLSLEQALIVALQRNRELQVERLEPVIRSAQEMIEAGEYDPELYASADYSEEKSTETARSTGERFDVEGESIDAVAGLAWRFPTGTDLDAGVTYELTNSDRTPEQQAARFGVTVTQALLRGFGLHSNLVDVRRARLDTRISQYRFRGFVEALAAETETAYWEYVLAAEEIAIYERSLEIARRRLEDIMLRIEVGDMPRNAAAAARAEAALREQALIDTKSVLEEKRLRLLRLVNARNDELFEVEVIPASPPETVCVPIADLPDRLNYAETRRPDLNEARLLFSRNELEVIRTRNGLLPKMDLFIDLGKTGYAESFSEAFKSMDGDTYELTAGLRFALSPRNRQASGRHIAARASRKQALEALENLRHIVQMDVRLAVNEVERTRLRIDAVSVTRELQKQALAAEEERFSVGESTSLLVAQAQRDLLESEIELMEAVVNYRIALVQLYLAEGTLLDRRGIRVNGLPGSPAESPPAY